MNPGIFTRDSATQIILSLFLLILVFVTITITSAEVTELNVTPEVVLPGETLLVTGKASLGEEVWLNASFEIALPVSDQVGEYLGEFNGIDIPAGEKKFSVTAEKIKNIRISLYPVFWHTIEYPLGGPLTATNGTATISISFPATYHGITIDIYGKKNVRVYGDAADNATSVNLTTELSIKVTANSTGDFSLDINTGGVPPGEFLITAGAIEKTVYIASAVEEKPDLVITEKWVCWQENCTICYNITNIGNGTAPAGHNTTLYVDGIEVAHDQVPVELAPNESYIGCFEGYDWIYIPPGT